jgi:DUF1009 family protein
MSASEDRLGIIAGGGELPIAIAETARSAGRAVFVLALEGMANADDVAGFPHAFASLGELGKAIKLLKDAGCSEITLAGKVTRPQFTKLRLDAKGALALPRVMAAALKGDDALLRTMLAIFESEGMRVLGSEEAARDLIAPFGPLGKFEPTDTERADVLYGAQVTHTMGVLDIGQAAVVCQGLVLAVEAAEGTDAMLMRVASLPEALRGTQADKRGVLVKTPKPHQERRVDLPVIGVKTLELAALAGLAGVAFEGGAALIVNRKGVAEAADRHGLFACGFAFKDLGRD